MVAVAETNAYCDEKFGEWVTVTNKKVARKSGSGNDHPAQVKSMD